VVGWLRPGALALGILVGGAGLPAVAEVAPAVASQWPAASAASRPWTRWWWLGSAVDEKNLTRELELFSTAGIGGVEICPIYGVDGWEARNVPFLSPRFMQLLQHTLAEAKRLGLRVDFTTGTGWPFGGPWVTDEDASSRLELARRELRDGALDQPLPHGTPRYVVAVSDGGERLDLTDQATADGRLGGGPTSGQWHIYAAVSQAPIQKVKRAAPGGEGSVVDPFSVASLDRYLARFDEAFASSGAGAPRAHFHDSYEYYGASFTERFFDAFLARRGYDLRGRIEALAGDGDADTVARVRSDYRATLADLHLEYVRRWTEWTHARGSLSRNQAHGAPGNLLDLYAAADVPETEVFRKMDEAMMPRLKLASSAAHLKGTTVASAEAFTWLGEHFSTPLSLVKRAADWLYLSGVNHLLFHGIPYSPAGEAWPGFQFYASVNFGPEGGLWHDLPALTAYLTRVQSVLQAGEPDADLLLYYSPDDFWSAPPPTVKADDLAPPNPVPPAFEELGLRLWRRGYAWDAVSEAKLGDARVEGDRIRIGAGAYRAVVVPRTRFLSAEAASRLAALASAGASVVFVGGLPADVPGFGRLEERRSRLRDALSALRALEPRGRALQGDDAEALLEHLGVPREALTDAGLQVVRRRTASGRDYFVVNRGASAFDGWAPLATAARSAVLLDPLAEASWGAASVRSGADGRASLRLQLEPGASMVVRTSEAAPASASLWPYAVPAGAAVALRGSWSVVFVEGGPVLPRPFETSALASWTSRDDPEAQRFAGTARYTLRFERPAGSGSDWLLDLGDVRESARVSLNGRSLGTLWTRPFRLRLGPALRAGANRLEVEVTNLAANRVRDLDRRGVAWKRFKDINVVNADYKPFDASSWPLADSGLLGPVTLTPLVADPTRGAAQAGRSR
jgi:hypothetical protein